MHPLLTHGFGLVCGQNPDHIWVLGGVPLPFCERCTGLYAGACLAWLALRFLRPGMTPAFLWSHAGLLVLMGPFGFHAVEQGPLLRTLSGAWFAFGLVVLLNIHRPSPNPLPAQRYWIAFLSSLVLIPLAARSNTAPAFWLLTLLGMGGAAALLFSVCGLAGDLLRSAVRCEAPAS